MRVGLARARREEDAVGRERDARPSAEVGGDRLPGGRQPPRVRLITKRAGIGEGGEDLLGPGRAEPGRGRVGSGQVESALPREAPLLEETGEAVGRELAGDAAQSRRSRVAAFQARFTAASTIETMRAGKNP